MMLRTRLISLAAVIGLAFVAVEAGASQAPVTLKPIPTSTDVPGDTLAVLYSGDGGWGPLDKGVAKELAAAGAPVIGVNSLSYFMTKRTPESAAQDLAEQVRRYETLWGRKRLVLVGYSFGADALPAIVPALPEDLRAQVRSVVLIGVGPTGELHFQPASWLNKPTAHSYPIIPAIASLKDVPTTCIYGDKEHNDVCVDLPVKRVELHGGHHFDGDYAGLGQAVVAAAL